MKRRDFISKSAVTTVGLTVLNSEFLTGAAFPGKISRDIGIQLYTLSKPLSDDFTGTIRKLAEFGYKNLEFAGPYYFSSEEEIKKHPHVTNLGLSGFGYYGYTPKEIHMMLDDLGLVSKSAHVSDLSLKYNIDEAIEAANIIGQKYILSPAFHGQTADQYKAAAELYNSFGEKCKAGGIRYGYHTHNGEFAEGDKGTLFDILVKETDPELVSFELDLFWAAVAGVNVIELIKQYPDRVKLLHIKDMAKPMDKPYTTFDPSGDITPLMQLIQNQAIIGEGIIDFKSIISQVEDTGIDHLIIEGDIPPEPVNFAKESVINLKKILSEI